MIWKAVPATALGIAALAAAGSCPEAPRHEETVAAPAPGEAVSATPAKPSWASPPSSPPAVRAAIERALPVLQADGDAWMEGTTRAQNGDGCVSCHQVPYGVWGLQEAARAGVEADRDAARDLTRRAASFIDSTRVGRPMSWSPMMLAIGDGGSERPAEVEGWTDYLLGAQRAAGFWEAKGQFPSQRRELSETNAVATMLAMLALAPAAAGDTAVAASVEAAWGWLHERGPGKSTEWLALGALVADGRGEEQEARRLVELLLAAQNENGGWGWNPGEKSNAMSTGAALWALDRSAAAARAAAREAAARRGLDYLLATQGEDGWWRVASDLVSRSREESKDYVYDYWGTAWATIGLARWHRATVTAAGERSDFERP